MRNSTLFLFYKCCFANVLAIQNCTRGPFQKSCSQCNSPEVRSSMKWTPDVNILCAYFSSNYCALSQRSYRCTSIALFQRSEGREIPQWSRTLWLPRFSSSDRERFYQWNIDLPSRISSTLAVIHLCVDRCWTVLIPNIWPRVNFKPDWFKCWSAQCSKFQRWPLM